MKITPESSGDVPTSHSQCPLQPFNQNWNISGTKRHISHQYSKTNVMHFLFNLLRIKGLYMFRALLAHLQEALHKLHLVYCVRVMSVGC
jgi:hypothetical protein